MEIRDKVTVVTGGASGIGEALCRRFAKEGAKAVVVADIDEQGARAVAQEIGGLSVRCDVRREEDVVHLVEKTEDEDWQRIWEVNVMSHVYAAKAVIPRMIARGGGYLLHTASAAGLLSQIGSAPYSVTKHAAVGLAENLAITYGDQGIKVSVLCPQAVRTAMTRQGGGVAAVDGMIEADQVADDVVRALAEERFLILPHPEVQTYMERKVADYDRWLSGMRRLQKRFLEGE